MSTPCSPSLRPNRLVASEYEVPKVLVSRECFFLSSVVRCLGRFYFYLLNRLFTALYVIISGEQRLAEFLAELGLPLLQCKQNFSTMDLELRKDVTNIFLSKAEKYSLNNMTYNSFISSHGYQHR